MPKRTDVKNILLIGSGPIVIGQACEFDYSGTQAVKTLKEQGYRVVLINSNPATIMTDPEFADATYIEPITKDAILRIIERERVDAILPTMGGQVALNAAMEVWESEEFAAKFSHVKFLGAKPEAIKKGEDRVAFKEAMLRIGMDLPKSHYAYNIDEAVAAASEIGFPLIIRASFTLGGAGSGVAYNADEFRALAEAGLEASPISEILIEESLLGWKEFEMEVIRDREDNCIVVCSIENIDPMGVHTGDSITIAPTLTLTDKEYQKMRDASFAILREIGVDTGGSNVQFAVEPRTGRMTVIEMNPRVSRSSALASKATGYPIAKVATLLAVGYTLDEIKNDITGTAASFEPVIDYIVTKIPRFTFEKFPGANSNLTTAMKSVGEVMAIGRTFKESIQKALCSLERDYGGFDELLGVSDADILFGLRNANEKRILQVAEAFRRGLDVEEIHAACKIDRYFLREIAEIVAFEGGVRMEILSDPELLRQAKAMGFSDKRIARLISQHDNLEITQNDVFYARQRLGVAHDYNEVDTCAGEFEALTPYLYSTTNPGAGWDCAGWDFGGAGAGANSNLGENGGADCGKNAGKNVCENLATVAPNSNLTAPNDKNHAALTTAAQNHAAQNHAATPTATTKTTPPTTPPKQKSVLIIGGGPNRIGQGIEFDYCCVHASFALRDLGVRSIMYNCNPETVSTDYDTSDVLYFEPIDFEHLRAVIEREQPDGVIVHFGGQTPLKFSKRLTLAGAKIIGTSARAIDEAEDRKKFSEFIAKIGVKQPRNDTATSESEAVAKAAHIGYPVLVRPSYVLGGRAMRRVHNEAELREYMSEAVQVSNNSPVLLDKFLQNATELDVDAICDGRDVFIGAVLEHVEEAGVHSGDSASLLPPANLSPEMVAQVEHATRKIALELGVVGLMNIQFAIYEGELYIIEVNPRASRTVPFVSKATGVPMAKVATRVMWQGDLAEALAFYDRFGVVERVGEIFKPRVCGRVSVKESVFPFNKLPGADLILGPEMKSTGEVMGISARHEVSFVKSQFAAKNDLPREGVVFLSLGEFDKPRAVELGRKFAAAGFGLLATYGTFVALRNGGLEAELVFKISEGRPNIEDRLKNGDVALVVNTSDSRSNGDDAYKIRQAVIRMKIPYFTNMNLAMLAANSLSFMEEAREVRSLQEWLGSAKK